MLYDSFTFDVGWGFTPLPGIFLTGTGVVCVSIGLRMLFTTTKKKDGENPS